MSDSTILVDNPQPGAVLTASELQALLQTAEAAAKDLIALKRSIEAAIATQKRVVARLREQIEMAACPAVE